MIGYSTYHPPFSSTAAGQVAAADPWMTVTEVAAELRVSKMTIYRAADGGHLHAIRAGRSIRIRRSWFEEWVRGGAQTYGEAS